MYIIPYSPSINVQSCHHEPVVPSFLADVDGFPVSADVRIGNFNDVRLVDDDVSFCVCCVDPLTGEVLRQQATGLDFVMLHCTKRQAIGNSIGK